MSSIRTYPQVGDIVRMVTRTAFEGIGYSYLLLPLVCAWLLVCFVSPPLLAVGGALLLDPWVAGAGVLAWLLQAANYLPVVQYLGAASGQALALPVASLMYLVMTVMSAVRRLTGGDARWRDVITETHFFGFCH